VSRRILVVEDESAIAEAICYALTEDGFEVETVADGEAALQAGTNGSFDLVLLDLRLPRISGIEVCRRLRRESNVPIIMVTAKDAEIDRVVGLEIGADDYVTKPFSMAELTSRVRALLRRQELDRLAVGELMQRVGGLVLDRARHRVFVDDREVHLTASEFKLLSGLVSQPERVFTRREIMEGLWDSSYVGDQRACDVHIANVRRKIERDPAHPERLLTVRGVGYKLVPA
jgi:two-component system, OmpR family, response regulator RegX3